MNEPQFPAYEDTTRAPTPAEYENRTNPAEPRMDIGQGDTPQPTFIPELVEEARLHPERQGIATDDDILREGEQRLAREQAESSPGALTPRGNAMS